MRILLFWLSVVALLAGCLALAAVLMGNNPSDERLVLAGEAVAFFAFSGVLLLVILTLYAEDVRGLLHTMNERDAQLMQWRTAVAESRRKQQP